MAQNMVCLSYCFIIATKHHDQGSLQKKVFNLSYSFRRLESVSDGAKAKHWAERANWEWRV